MTSNKTAFTVGLFLIIGLAIAVSVIIWVGMSSYFEDGKKYAAYFDESVQGLDRDSPVKYRGVSIGRVHRIAVAPDGALIEVILSIETDLKVEADMVAQLKSVGITGIMFIELDQKAKDMLDQSPILRFSPEYPVISTMPSGMKIFINRMDDILSLITDLNMRELSDKLKLTLDTMNRAVEHLDVIISNTNSAISRIDNILMKNEKNLNQAISGFSRSVTNAETFLKEGVDLLNRSDARFSEVYIHFLTILQNLEKTSNELKSFAETISDQPSQLLFGEPLPARRLKK